MKISDFDFAEASDDQIEALVVWSRSALVALRSVYAELDFMQGVHNELTDEKRAPTGDDYTNIYIGVPRALDSVRDVLRAANKEAGDR